MEIVKKVILKGHQAILNKGVWISMDKIKKLITGRLQEREDLKKKLDCEKFKMKWGDKMTFDDITIRQSGNRYELFHSLGFRVMVVDCPTAHCGRSKPQINFCDNSSPIAQSGR